MPDAPLARRDLFRLAGFVGLAAMLPGSSGLAGATFPRSEPPPTEAPRFVRIKVGSIEGIIGSDGVTRVAPIQPTFGPEASPDDLNQALDRAFHPRAHADMEFNAVVLRIGRDVILFDAGSGSPDGSIGKLPANLAAAGVKREEITAVVITHSHFDHLGGVSLKDGTLAYPNAKILVARNEIEFWTGATPNLTTSRLAEGAKRDMVADIQKRFAAVKERIVKIEPGAKIFPGVEVLETYGHTPGHISLMVDGGNDQLCIAADIAHNHVVTFANPAWTTLFDVDPQQAAASRAKLFDRLASDRTRVLGYHLPWPGLGHVRRDRIGYEWIIEPWGS